MTPTRTPGRRPRPARPIERAEILIIVVLALAGAVWGAAWQRTAALTDIAAVAPFLLAVIGPGLLAVYLLYRVTTGKFELRMDGYGAAVLVVAALVANVLTPALAPSVGVGGRVTGTLDGQPLDALATCTWGAGRSAVIRVRATLPELIAAPAGQSGGSFTTNLPTGTLTLELPAGSLALTDIPGSFGLTTLPIRNGSGNVGEGDRATGSITFDQSSGALVAGQLSWTCEAAPAK
jgi:hypothetical protein